MLLFNKFEWYENEILYIGVTIHAYGQNGQIPTLAKIFSNLPLFVKYLAIYYCFKTRVHEAQIIHRTQV